MKVGDEIINNKLVSIHVQLQSDIEVIRTLTMVDVHNGIK